MAGSPRFPFHLAGLMPVCLVWILLSQATAATLRIGEHGAHLYLNKDAASEKIATLQPGEEVIPILQIVGQDAWYRVKTREGRVGWLKASEVARVEEEEEEISVNANESVVRFASGSTWSARTRDGKLFGGTWTGAIDRAKGTASGSWTLKDAAGRDILRGTWSANKLEQEWKGAWRALIVGHEGERSGTWDAAIQIPSNASLAEMFEKAVSQTVSGQWQTAGQAGSWSIIAVR
jgi:hypothetical protein